MNSYQVKLVQRRYYDEITVINVDADSAEAAGKAAQNFLKKNPGLDVTERVCLSERPHIKIGDVSLLGECPECACDTAECSNESTDSASVTE